MLNSTSQFLNVAVFFLLNSYFLFVICFGCLSCFNTQRSVSILFEVEQQILNKTKRDQKPPTAAATMSVFSQFWLLLGKNFTLRKRQPVILFVEFIWPIVLLLIVAFIKRASPPSIVGPCKFFCLPHFQQLAVYSKQFSTKQGYYQPLELPNGDFLSFMKSFVCMLDYKCHDRSKLKDTASYQNQYVYVHSNPF